VKHPLDEQLRAKAPNQNQKLRTIPVRMIFNDPELNLRAEYSLFDRQTGRLICSGNGKPVSDLDKTALNNIHAHHLIYVHWHKVDCANPMDDSMSI
jgi:hypothetical protein